MGISLTRNTTTLHQGFTLIEMIGVLAIIAILSAGIAPSIIKQVIRAKADQETANLETLSRDLVRYIKDNKIIPSNSGTNWATAIAQISNLPVNDIVRNKNGYTRRYYVDPMFMTNSNVSGFSYTQGTGLTSRPFSPRIMLVSNMNANAPAQPSTNAAFSAIWDQTAGATVVESESIRIERINLQSLFNRILLSNQDTGNQPSFNLESGSNLAIALAPSATTDGETTRYVINSTRVNLNAAPFPATVKERSFVVNSDKSYRYQFDGTNYNWVQQ